MEIRPHWVSAPQCTPPALQGRLLQPWQHQPYKKGVTWKFTTPNTMAKKNRPRSLLSVPQSDSTGSSMVWCSQQLQSVPSQPNAQVVWNRWTIFQLFKSFHDLQHPIGFACVKPVKAIMWFHQLFLLVSNQVTRLPNGIFSSNFTRSTSFKPRFSASLEFAGLKIRRLWDRSWRPNACRPYWPQERNRNSERDGNLCGY